MTQIQVKAAIIGRLADAQARADARARKQSIRRARRESTRERIQARHWARAGAGALAEVLAEYDWRDGVLEIEARWARAEREYNAPGLPGVWQTLREHRAKVSRERRHLLKSIRQAALAEREARDAVGDWLGSIHPIPVVRRSARRWQTHPGRVPDDLTAVLSGTGRGVSLRAVALGCRGADFQPRAGARGTDYPQVWARIHLDRVASFLGAVGQTAARAAAGHFGKVSSTSIDEAGAAGRGAVVDWLSSAVFGAPGGFMTGVRAFRVPDEISPALERGARRVAIAAGRASLLGDLTGGQSGRTEALRIVRRAAVESLDSIVRGFDAGVQSIRELWVDRAGEDGLFRLAPRFDALPADERELARAGRSHALDLVLAVRRVRAEALGRGRPKVRGHAPFTVSHSRGWQGRYALLIQRYGRIARVLSGIAQGESLELACRGAGFGFEASDGRSRAFSRALAESGVLGALVRSNAKRASV